MDRKKLDKVRARMAQMRRSPQTSGALEGLASDLGRRLNGKRGKHPIWVNDQFPSYPLSIPRHSGEVPPGTRNSILNQLEDDLIAWENWLDS